MMVLATALSGSACITIYHPLSSLQRPTVVDPTRRNFEGLDLEVRCFSGGALDDESADRLCGRMEQLFGGQGASVSVWSPRGGMRGASADDGLQGEGEAAPKTVPDLVLELRSREIDNEANVGQQIFSALTATTVPASREYIFAQDVVVRGEGGFVLASDTLRARFVRYIGWALALGNWLLDVTVRDEDEELTRAAKTDFSNDFYRQVTQLVFNARLRNELLRGGT